MKTKSILSVCTLCFFLSAPITQAETTPVINKVDFSTVVTINGNNFGTTGPNVILHDTFSGGITDDKVKLASDSGSWSGYGTYQPTYDAYARSAPHSMRAGNPITSQMQQLNKVFPSPTTEVFISYWVAIPPGSNFPNTTLPATFSNQSAWKFAWLMDTAMGYMGNDDFCIPTYIGPDQIMLAGNAYTPSPYWQMPRPITTWWSWTRWVRFTTWLKANEVNSLSNGNATFQILVEDEKQINQAWTQQPVFKDTSVKYPDGSKWDRLAIPGWYRQENSSNVRPTYDDIYVAIGANAQARVEIGDAPVYTDCKNLSILQPISWSNDTIVAKILDGTLKNNKYIFVIDANGNRSTGFFLPPPTIINVQIQ